VAEQPLLLEEPPPEQLGLLARCFPGTHCNAIACHLDPGAGVDAQIQAPGGVVVATEIESLDREAVAVVNVRDGGRPLAARTAAGRRNREYRLSAGEKY
jgi:hypothetical protein